MSLPIPALPQVRSARIADRTPSSTDQLCRHSTINFFAKSTNTGSIRSSSRPIFFLPIQPLSRQRRTQGDRDEPVVHPRSTTTSTATQRSESLPRWLPSLHHPSQKRTQVRGHLHEVPAYLSAAMRWMSAPALGLHVHQAAHLGIDRDRH